MTASSQVLSLQVQPQGYLGPQTTVPQVQLWGSPLAQKAGGRHGAVGLA